MGRHPEHSIEEIDDFITACEDDYANTNKQNMAQLSIDAPEHLMIDDLKEKRRYVIKAIGGEKEKANYSKNELDALTCTLYNGNDYDDSDSLSYHFIKSNGQNTKEDALNILHKAVANEWYGDMEEGMLKRRLTEVNVYYNNDYTFYFQNGNDETTMLEKLKRDTGFSK